MPSKEDASSFLDIVKLELSALADRAHKAAIGSAQALSDNLRDTADELMPETSIVVDRVKSALQSSAVVAGEQLRTAGTEFLQAIRNARQR